MSAPAKKTYLRAGELARASGVSTDTLRHYERKGVLPKPRRSPNGYREYAAESLARVLLVRRALAFGFTLDELARVLSARARRRSMPRGARARRAPEVGDNLRLRGDRQGRARPHHGEERGDAGGGSRVPTLPD